MTLLLAACMALSPPDSAHLVHDVTYGNALGLGGGIRSAVRDSRGNLHLVFTKDEYSLGDSNQMYHTSSSDGGVSWTSLVDVSRNPRAYAFSGTLTVGPNDDVACVWFQPDSSWTTYDYWLSRRVDSGWTEPTNISRAHTPSNYAYQSTLAVDPTGRVHVAYEMLIGGLPDIYYTAQFGDTWLTPALVSSSQQDDGFPTMVCDRGGTLHLCWRLRGADSGYVMYARHDSAWSQPARVCASPWAVAGPCLTAGSGGQVHLVYVGYRTPQSSDVYFAELVGDTWAAPVNVSQGRESYVYAPTTAVDSFGGVYVVWSQNDGGYRHELKYRYRAAEWSPVVPLTNDSVHDSYEPRLAEMASPNAADLFWLYAERPGTYGIYQMALSPVGQGVTARHESGRTAVGVEARPSPFAVSVELAVPMSQARTSISIFSTDGVLVRRLGLRPRETRVVWDGMTEVGVRVRRGVYTIEAKTGDWRYVVRVVRL